MYIFLDIDGVLNKESDWKIPYSLDPHCIHNFAKFVHSCSDIKIVLTSTWKNGFDKSGNHSPQIKKLIQMFEKEDLAISDITKSGYNKDREDEIDFYLKRNQINEPFIIIDDDESLYHGSKQLYLVDSRLGFTKEDAKNLKKRI